MTLSVTSTPGQILKQWKASMDLADSTIGTVGAALNSAGGGKRVDITVSLETLRRAAKNLDNAHKIAIEKVILEDKCYCCLYQNFLVVTGTALDTVLQITTMGLWINLIASNGTGTGAAAATIASTAGSTVASKIKDWIWRRNERLLERLAQLEEIIPNRGVVDQVDAMIKVFAEYEHFQINGRPESSHQRVRTVPHRYRDAVSEEALHRTSSDLRGVFQGAVRRIISESMIVMPPPEGRLLGDRYVTRICGVYPRLDGDVITELEEELMRLRELVENEIASIGVALNKNGRADLTLSITQLEGHLQELKRIFVTVSEILEVHEEIEGTRSACITAGFRTALQLVLELGSLASCIVEAFSVQGGSSSEKAQVAGFSLYLINVIFSWVSGGISKMQVSHMAAFQQVKRLNGQSAFVEQVSAMREIFVGYKKVASETDLNEAAVSRVMRAEIPQCFRGIIDKKGLRGRLAEVVMEKAPQVATPGSALDRRIQELWRDSQGAGDVKPSSQWRQYLRDSSVEANLGEPAVMVTVTAPSPIRGEGQAKKGLTMENLVIFRDYPSESEMDDSANEDKEKPRLLDCAQAGPREPVFEMDA